MTPLPGTELNCYLADRLRDRRRRLALNVMIWTAALSAMIVMFRF